MLERFESLDHPAGLAAAKFLRSEALANAAMTRTHLLLADDRIEGFFSLSSASVRLSGRSIRSLGLRTAITTIPAILMTWVARHRNSEVSGLELVETAFALARESALNVGAAAFVLDPWDERVAEIWRNEPYPFRDSEQARKNKPPRLWAPLDPR
ncbi:MAG TPA: hypothetical protein VGB06_01505 [Solirubrobacterales bacterium]|jgi:hypothetical protein